MVAMAMGDDDGLDPRRIDTKLRQAADDVLVGLFPIVQRVDQDNAVAGIQRPGGDDAVT